MHDPVGDQLAACEVKAPGKGDTRCFSVYACVVHGLEAMSSSIGHCSNYHLQRDRRLTTGHSMIRTYRRRRPADYWMYTETLDARPTASMTVSVE
jgi:hypothetical protein